MIAHGKRKDDKMERTSLKTFNVTEIKVTNRKRPGEKIELENQYKYNVHGINETICSGEFRVTVCDKNDRDNFSVYVNTNAIFEHAKEKTKTELHIESMAEMFPYVRSLIITVTASMGIVPITIPPIDFGNISIVNVQFPPK